jgi:polyribonucleotide nucleotidyltransferase
MPGKDGLLHISEIKWERLENMEGVLEPGEEIMVKLIDVDKKPGSSSFPGKCCSQNLKNPRKKTEFNKVFITLNFAIRQFRY